MSPSTSPTPSIVRGKLISTSAYSDDDWYLNACVGKNTGAHDNSVGYSSGFQAAAETMLRLLGVPPPPQASENWGAYPLVDMLVYPICYCARHHVELVLKASLPKAWAIFKLRSPHDPKGLSEPRATEKTHSVLQVWAQLHAISEKSDSRLAELTVAIRPYVDDIDAIDASGQTFRYASDAENGTRHLNDLSHINLRFFADGYAELCVLLERLELELDAIRGEYLSGTFTSKLIREDLFKVAKRLPHVDQWSDPSFTDIKRVICDDFKLGSKDFQKACSIIKTSRLLSWRVGIVQPIIGLSKDTFVRLQAARHANLRAPAELTLDQRSSVLGLIRVGSLMYFPEEFDTFVTALPEDEEAAGFFEQEREVHYLARKVAGRPDIVATGLQLLGQHYLLEDFRSVYRDELGRLTARENQNDEKLERFKNALNRTTPEPKDGVG